MEIPNFIPDANETGTATTPEVAPPENFLETTIPLEVTATPQASQEKPQTGWRREADARHERYKKSGNGEYGQNSSDHKHYYELEDNLRETSIGRCVGCGTEKEFKNHIEDIVGYVPGF